MSAAVGERVCAILGTREDDKTIDVLGSGVRVEDDVPTEAVGAIAEMLVAARTVNPRILLDDGEFVFGCECWWGPESAVRQRLSAYRQNGYKIQRVSIAEVREKFKRECLDA